MLLVLFVPDDEVVFRNEVGAELVYAMHALRLGFQGIELLTTGRISLPVPQPHLDCLRSVRRGETPLAQVTAAIKDAEAQLVRLRDSQSVPSHPDNDWVDQWLHRSYLTYWATTTEDH